MLSKAGTRKTLLEAVDESGQTILHLAGDLNRFISHQEKWMECLT